jgi:hypothetical protein
MRIEMPWKIYITSNHAAVTRSRNGYLAKTTSKYFTSKEAAVLFCGDEKLVIYCPGEAHKNV